MQRDKVLNNTDPPTSLKDMAINAGISAGLSFFTTLAGISIVTVMADPIRTLIAAGISAGFTFFSSLAIQRGLKKEGE